VIDDPRLVAVAALAIALVATGIMRAYAARRGLVDVPNDRSSHLTPTPRGGGLAMVTALALAVLLHGRLSDDELMFALGIVGVMGFLDDARWMPAWLKMAAIVYAATNVLRVAVVAVACDVPFAGAVDLGPLAGALTVAWVASYANAFNFMDGIDGIASLTAALSAAAFAVAGAHRGDAMLAGWAAAACGASLGFLPWNFPKARVFMGDCGSLPLGVLLAWCAVRANASGAMPFPASVLLLGPFLFDVTITLARRVAGGRRIGEAHREHLYQRLSRLWGSHAKVSLLYAGFTAVTGTLALCYASMSDTGKLLSLALPLAAMLGFAALVLRAERRKGV
jgi:Fuc2NAc and GlcNAc transferase